MITLQPITITFTQTSKFSVEDYLEWCWTMTHDDGEFFNYLQSDYVKYEEDMYYMRKEDL